MEYSKKVLILEKEICERVYQVCKKIHSLKNSYSDFRPEISSEMREKEKAKAIDIFQSDLELTLKDVDKLGNTITKSISSKKKPHITAGDGTGSIEFNSALMFVNSLPEAWQEILKDSFNDGRYDFCFSVLNLMDKKEPRTKHIAESLEKDFEKSLGIEGERQDLKMINDIKAKSDKLLNYSFPDSDILWNSFGGDDLLIIKEIDENFYEKLRAEKYPDSNENGKAGFFADVGREQFEARGWVDVMEGP